MAQLNPISMEMDPRDPKTQKLIAMGVQALKSGAVSPAEAAKNAQKMGFSPYGQPGGQIGPPTEGEAQAKLQASANQQAQANQAQVVEQADPSITLGSGRKVSLPSGQMAAPQVVPPGVKAAGSGLEEKNTAGTNVTGEVKSNEMQTLSPEQIQGLYDQYASMPQFKEQSAGIDRLQELLAMESRREAPVNIAKPLQTISDMENHTNFAAGMPSPETPQQRSQRILEFTQKLQQDKRDVSKNIIDAIGKSKGGSLEQLLKTVATAGASAAAVDPNKEKHGNPGSQYISFARQTQSEGKDLRQRAELVDTAIRALSSGNPTAQAGLPALAARIIEGTVRPQLAVIQKEGGDPSGWQQLLQVFTKVKDGHITPENAAQYMQMFAQLRQQVDADVGAFTKRSKVTADKIGMTDQEFQDSIRDWVDPHGASSAARIGKMPKPENITNYSGAAAPKKPKAPAAPSGIDDFFAKKAGK